ncbi:MAG: type IX secretion system sortase PorU [Gracilimonas sp.]
MLNKLLFISGLLCLLIAQVTEARQLKVVAETNSFTDYEFINNELIIMSPIGVTVPVAGNTPRFQVLEQVVTSSPLIVSPERAHVISLSDINKPLIEISEPGGYRGQRVSALSINVARFDESETEILQKLKLRVYKGGDAVIPNTQMAKSAQSANFNSGIWYKIPITRNSIYTLNADYLEELGINFSEIDPRNIQVWGTGGYQLPEQNSEPRPQLTQIPILVEGQTGESFDNNDRVIFYANSPNKVTRENGTYSHSLHPYSNENYVFLTIADQPGSRLSVQNSNINPSRTITSFKDFIWKEDELYKVEERIKSGRNWLGQRFESSSNGTLVSIFSDTLSRLIPNQPIEISGQFVNRSTSNASFQIQVNGSQISTLFIPQSGSYTSSEGRAGVARSFSETLNGNTNGDIIEVSAAYNHNANGSTGYFDWLRIEAERELRAENGLLYFYSPEDGAENERVQYELTGFSNEPIVMDVTDATSPKLLSGSFSGNIFSFNYKSGDDLHFIAQSAFRTPEPGKRIEQQHLRGISDYPDYVIVTSPDFLDHAQELASYRANEDGLTPVVVTQEQIMNEFSGGGIDPAAIRDYTKFLYDRALTNNQEPPKYLLLFGDTTFDYKGIISNSFTNYVVTYQSEESLHRTASYATDDFFGFMDDNEGDLDINGSGETPGSHLLDIGIGRISAQTRAEASVAVQKIKDYENPANTGSWQNLFSFAADDDFPDVERNKDLHVLNADETAERMNIIEPGIRLKKIYEFDYAEEITGGGREVPGATQDFINTINNGTLVLNYSGHGNEQTLSDENLFRSEYIPNLTNRDRLTVLVTATCQFGRYDDIDAQSGAEQLVFASNGGAIAAFTTTRVVYTGSGITARNNFGLNVALSQRMIERSANNTPKRFGDIYLDTKNTSIGGSPVITSRNSKKFILIGDPAIKFRLPESRSEITSVNDYTETGQDTTLTIRALDQVTLSGSISELDGTPLNSFNGEASITVLDANRTVNLPADRDWVQEDRCNLTGCRYTVENDVLYRGKAGVENGQFNSTFIVPKDISFSDSTGRIIVFANSEGKTAGGSFTKIKFNGINEDAVDDKTGPKLDIYLNDERFVNGNLVNSSPNLIIELEDQSGINTTGTGVGHELIATIDTKPQQSFVLNDFYEGSLNDFTRGRVEYPLDEIPEGSYSLKVRAWDVHNNFSEEEIFFEVASNDELSVRNVYNYPNPMNNVTRFTFEHNQPGNPLDVSVRIFTLSGKPVQYIENQLITTSSYASISWDGRDRDHNRLGNGTYIYVLRVATNTPKGRQKAEQIEKLVIIR